MSSYSDLVKLVIRDYIIVNFGNGKPTSIPKDEPRPKLRNQATIEKVCDEILNGKFIHPKHSKINRCLQEVLQECKDSLWGNLQVALHILDKQYPMSASLSTPHVVPTWAGLLKKPTMCRICDSCGKKSDCIRLVCDVIFGYNEVCCSCSILNSRFWHLKNEIKYCYPMFHDIQS
jgi:hypothetical protein